VTGVAAGLAMAAAGAVSRQPWLTALGLSAPIGYAALTLVASAQSAMTPPRLDRGAAVRLPLVYATMHGSWGLGFLRGIPRSERSSPVDEG
jgi:hypothetical protein